MPELIIASGENNLAAELRAIDVPYSMQPLPLADIIIRKDGATEDEPPLVLIERKTIKDLIASIKDGRYKEQSNRLSQINRPVWWLIEGNLPRFTDTRNDKSMVFGAIASLGLTKGFTPVRTTSTAESAILLKKMLAKSEQLKEQAQEQEGGWVVVESGDAASAPEPMESIPHKRFKGDCINKNNIQSLMLAQIPGVSVARAEAIIKEISLGEILGGKAIPRTIKCVGSGKSTTPRAIPKNDLGTIEDYLQPKQSQE